MLSLTFDAGLLTGARLKMRTRYAVRIAVVFTLVLRMRWQFFCVIITVGTQIFYAYLRLPTMIACGDTTLPDAIVPQRIERHDTCAGIDP
jgi:hypothetical protein